MLRFVRCTHLRYVPALGEENINELFYVCFRNREQLQAARQQGGPLHRKGENKDGPVLDQRVMVGPSGLGLG
jgi:hypothetical protein